MRNWLKTSGCWLCAAALVALAGWRLGAALAPDVPPRQQRPAAAVKAGERDAVPIPPMQPLPIHLVPRKDYSLIVP